ncbi:MAG: hypothetical protein MST03_06140 [Bacteroidales bacterium]|nr:hypothetical protein [Bacteroidales bacterium]
MRCKGTTKIAHGNGLSPDLWGSCPLTCETAWEKRLNINLTPDGRLMVYMRKVELTRYFNPHAFANEIFTELANAKADLGLV